MSSRIQTIIESSEVVVAAAVPSLAFPPVSVGLVTNWNASVNGSVPEFDLVVWSTGSLSLTASELYGAQLRALVYADNDITTVTHGTETYTKVAHALLTGDGPIQLTTSGVLPAGLSLLTDYWVVKTDADNFRLAASFNDSMARTPVIVAISGNGTGTHTVVDTALTKRAYWHSYGVITTPITLTNARAFAVRCSHNPRTVAYALAGTLSAGTVSVSVMPISER